MNIAKKVSLVALAASSIAVAGASLAQSTYNAGNTNPDTFSTWMTDQSKTNNGYITRDAYMAEAGRRWDMTDKNHQGLTMSQVRSTYGYEATGSAATRTSDKMEGHQAPAVQGPTK